LFIVVLPVILDAMKTAISLPDELSREIDARARALKLSRSAFLARAARELLDNLGRTEDPTDAWNRAIDEAGQPGDDPAAVAARRRTKAIVVASAKTRRDRKKKRR
jgi:hypothetical protein